MVKYFLTVRIKQTGIIILITYFKTAFDENDTIVVIPTNTVDTIS